MSEDINVTDGTVLESLNNKIDIDGGNYIGSGLEEIITNDVNTSKVGFPDYSNATKITGRYTAPSDGWIIGCISTPENSNKYYVYINGQTVAYSMGKYDRSNGDSNISLPVKKGDVFSYTDGLVLTSVYFMSFR